MKSLRKTCYLSIILLFSFAIANTIIVTTLDLNNEERTWNYIGITFTTWGLFKFG